MKRITFFSHLSPATKFLWFFFIVIVFALIFSLVGILAGKVFLHLDMNSLRGLMANPQNRNAISFLYLYQVINELGVFILAPLFFIFLIEPRPGNFLHTRSYPNIIPLLLAGVSIYTILPFINLLSGINAHLALPESLSGIQQWMKAKEMQADDITTAFLSVKSLGGLGLNIVIIAFLPAIGEELVFRGIVQQLLQAWTKNKHWGIILAALLFSAMHMQFFGFLPRFVLGALLGYLFVFTKNLWVPIFAHFINNASSIIIFYLHYNGFISVKMENFGALPNVYGIAASLFLTLWLLYFIKHHPRRKTEII